MFVGAGDGARVAGLGGVGNFAKRLVVVRGVIPHFRLRGVGPAGDNAPRTAVPSTRGIHRVFTIVVTALAWQRGLIIAKPSPIIVGVRKRAAVDDGLGNLRGLRRELRQRAGALSMLAAGCGAEGGISAR